MAGRAPRTMWEFGLSIRPSNTSAAARRSRNWTATSGTTGIRHPSFSIIGAEPTTVAIPVAAWPRAKNGARSSGRFLFTSIRWIVLRRRPKPIWTRWPRPPAIRRCRRLGKTMQRRCGRMHWYRRNWKRPNGPTPGSTAWIIRTRSNGRMFRDSWFSMIRMHPKAPAPSCPT